MKLNETQRSLLRIRFNSNMAATRDLRQKRARLFRRGRRLRKAGAERNSTKTVRLHDLGVELNRRGRALVGSSPGWPSAPWTLVDGRSLTLALAFLNGTPYGKAEAKPRTAPLTRYIASLVLPCLLLDDDPLHKACPLKEPLAERLKQTEDLVRRWVKEPTARPRDLEVAA